MNADNQVRNRSHPDWGAILASRWAQRDAPSARL